MKVYGELEIHDTFKITGHGMILTGKIISKKNNIRINIGDKISFKYNGEKIIRNI